jgi:hypothetical protein
MPIKTSKSHKSQKTDSQPKPRQRNIAGVIAIPGKGSLPAVSPSSDSMVAQASMSPDKLSGDEKKETATGIPEEAAPEKQPWYRAPDSKLKPKADKIAVMRAAGTPVSEIAKRLKTTEANVRFIEYIARKNGWYDLEDEPVDLEAELALSIDRKVVRNISASLDGQMTNWQTHEMTIKAAGGRGIFKNHDKDAGTQQQMTVVAIRVEMPPIGAGDQKVIETNLGGVPAYTEGEVEDVQPLQLGHGRGEFTEAVADVVSDSADGLPRSR